ncbi:LysR family transcriptional regulator [Acidovorax sp. SUPP3334]|uniref:LysR family transcriptional regulator n=1 Tax=Acidovorax sp. SUPP3334 TaxID=2920881 RepID=UPI0023DE5385|nr:LysR family transcriptional regulator [Acidovorax sp. SUPP3334]GKT23404.1 LysR family transcriptional regulator [Acidovorax sp. SUPP3334]
MERTLDLDQLRTFALVLELGSFSAAALRLGVTQPAVSLQVRNLERRLSVRLIERLGRRVGPTPAGADLLAHVPHVSAAVANAVSAATFHSAGVTGRVRLGTGLTSCLYLLPPILHDLRRRYPSLSIIVSTGNTDDYVRRIEDNSIDAAIVTLPIVSRAVAAIPIVQDELMAICRRGTCDWPAAVTPQMLNQYPLVKFEPGSSTRGIVDAWLSTGGGAPPPAAVMEFDSVEAIKAMVAAGLGCSILPRMALSGYNRRNDDLELRPLDPPLYRTQAIITRHDKPMNRGLQKVIEAIVEGGKAAAPPGR